MPGCQCDVQGGLQCTPLHAVCVCQTLCVCCVSRRLAAGCGVCLLFCVVAVFVQRASGCVVRLSGPGKLRGVYAGLCAPGMVRGAERCAGNAECASGRWVCWVPGEGSQDGVGEKGWERAAPSS